MSRRPTALALLLSAGILSVTLSAAPAGAEDFRAGDLVLESPWVRATIGNLRMTGGYLTVRNEGNRDDRLLAVEMPAAGSVELHVTQDGAMRQVEAFEVPAGGTLEIVPGGNHLMIQMLEGPLAEGETTTAVLHFEQAGEVTVTFTVEAANALAPASGE